MTALLEAPAPPAATERAAPPRRTLLLVVALASAAVALLVTSALPYAPSAVRIPPVAPGFTGTAPLVTLPTYGLQGMHVIGYEHGASAMLTLPVHNGGMLPMTVTSVDLGGGVAPLLEVAEVVGLPLSLPPGATRTLEVRATLANCRFFHERQVQNYPSVRLGFSVLGQDGLRDVPYDRPLMVHSPMIVGCPERQLDRQADNRTDLMGAG